MINLIVSLAIRRGPGVVMKVAGRNNVLLTTRVFDVAKLTTVTPLLLISSCKLSFHIVGLKIPLSQILL